ncbi:hypothetical protein [Glycomyces sp. YM15]|uniref:hypothetical protein n=1 Tax=Glycomyces sp. YM15 TaxID=2800446 RepID=UPI001962E633|nr:hypothetical protein [Glycomyces sp. YM15]
MTDGSHSWLPEHQLGVAATLSHADDLIGQVGDLLFEYQLQPDVLRLAEVPTGAFSKTVVERVAPIPRKVPLLVADALVALRAALEHVLFAEVEFLDGSPLDKKAARLIEMPASTTWEHFEEWKKQRRRNGPPSLRTGGALLRRIGGLQPYHRPHDPHEHPLARLTLHTNHAKHRMPAVTAVRLAAMYRDDQRPRSLKDLPPRPETPMRVGDVLAETPIGVQIPVSLFPTIGINRPDTDRWPVLMHELDEIFHWVRTQAVPRLITSTDPPSPALPTHYEIAVGHENERQAIAAGSTTSAAERHSNRTNAAWAREELVHLIGQMPSAPTCAQIVAWLDHLTDEEVVARVKRLHPTDSQYNAAVMAGLRAEASDFEDDQSASA